MVDGILPLYKPKGLTSHDCVMKVRKLFQTKKVGHTGTLDPDVDGVLPICIGRATKIVEYLTNADKIYQGEITLGYTTTTEDASGEIIDSKPVESYIDQHDIMKVLDSFIGEITQIPPMYSAVKVNGKRLYEYAREGKPVERPKRMVSIKKIELIDESIRYANQKLAFKFEVTCSKGTYIRTLAVDIGKKLGYPAHMSDLTRIGSANFKLQQTVTFEKLELLQQENKLESVLHNLEDALADFPKLIVDKQMEEKIKNGAVLPIPSNIEKNSLFTIYSEESGLCLAIYKMHPEKSGMMKPEKVLRNI